MTPQVLDFDKHLKLTESIGQEEGEARDLLHGPLFSGQVVEHRQGPPVTQYGLLGREASHHAGGAIIRRAGKESDKLIYGNHAEPWSAFICGSQGSGKSHTLATLLENSILHPAPAGELPNPLSAIAFHWDEFTGAETTQFCELAYFCTKGIKVQVLVSPANYDTMKKLYENLPGLPGGATKPEVQSLQFLPSQLSIESILTLMSVSDQTATPLYVSVISRMLREMAVKRKGLAGIDYNLFRKQVDNYKFTDGQRQMLDMRLQMLDEFVDKGAKNAQEIWGCKPGTLTIVDLSSAFVQAGDACALFWLCLNFFMAGRGESGRVVILGEAHKFLTDTGEAQKLIGKLTSMVCQQRHLGTRVLIATQEPTLDTRLLGLCTVKIIHRFDSKAWYRVLQEHVAGTGPGGEGDEVFKQIVRLPTGHALLFASTAMLHVEAAESETDTDSQAQAVDDAESRSAKIVRLRDDYVEIRIRQRTTLDGGVSISADQVRTKRDANTADTKGLEKQEHFDATKDSEGDDSESSEQESMQNVDSIGAARIPFPETQPMIPFAAPLSIRLTASGSYRTQTELRETFIEAVRERVADAKSRGFQPDKLDFGIVRSMVRKQLGLAQHVFMSPENKNTSKNVIKECIVSPYVSMSR